MPSRLAPVLVVLALAGAGCGKKQLGKKETHPVQGRLLMGGQPVRFAIVQFTPTQPGKGADADGHTDEDGVFRLRTYSNEDPDGAIPGEYKITIEEYSAARVGAVPAGVTPTKVPPQLRSPDRTLTVKAEDNDLGDINID